MVVIGRLVIVLFFGLLLALACHAAMDRLLAPYLSIDPALQAYWYGPYVLLPAALLIALAYGLGFFRRGGSRLADGLACLLIAAIVVLTLDAPYSCWAGITVRCYD